MESITNIFLGIGAYISSLNPAQVNWSSVSSIIFYVVQILLTIFIIIGIVLAIQNAKHLPSFIKGVGEEMNNMSWLSRKKGFQYFLLVLTIIIVFTFIIFISDRALLSVRNLIIFPQV